MSPEKLIKVMERFKELGLTTMKCEGLELSNTQAASKPVETHSIEPTPGEISKIAAQTAESEMTDEEIRYWATPYYDELQRKKEELKKGNRERDNLNG